MVGAYHASKWGLEGLSQALAQEVASFGIHVTLVEPGGYDTDWAGPSAKHSDELPAYAEVHAQAAKERAQRVSAPGVPAATREAILASSTRSSRRCGCSWRGAAGDRDRRLRIAAGDLA